MRFEIDKIKIEIAQKKRKRGGSNIVETFYTEQGNTGKKLSFHSGTKVIHFSKT